MIKILWLLLLVSVAWRVVLGRWPWHDLSRWLGTGGPASGTRRERQIAKARALLEIGPAAGRDEILAAHRRVIARVHPDRGGNSEKVHDANDARDILLSTLSHDSQETQ